MRKSIKYGIISCLAMLIVSISLVFVSKIYLSHKKQDSIQQDNITNNDSNKNDIVVNDEEDKKDDEDLTNDENETDVEVDDEIEEEEIDEPENEEEIENEINEEVDSGTDNELSDESNNNSNNNSNDNSNSNNTTDQSQDNKNESDNSQNGTVTKPSESENNKPIEPPKYDQITDDSKDDEAINNPNKIKKEKISLKKYIDKYEFAKQTTSYQDYFNKKQLLFDPIRLRNNTYNLIEKAIFKTNTYNKDTMSLKIKASFNLVKNSTKVHLLIEWTTKLSNIGFNVIKNYYDIITITL